MEDCLPISCYRGKMSKGGILMLRGYGVLVMGYLNCRVLVDLSRIQGFCSRAVVLSSCVKESCGQVAGVRYHSAC